MRLVNKNHHVYDNVVQSQFELYRNGAVIGTARYRLEGGRIVFMLCATNPPCSPPERRAFYLMAVRDANHRHLNVGVSSRSMLEELRPLGSRFSGTKGYSRRD